MTGGTAGNILARECTLNWGYRTLPGDDPWEVQRRAEAYVAELLLPKMKAKHPDADIQMKRRSFVPGLLPQENEEAAKLALQWTGGNRTYAVPYGTEAGIFRSHGITSVGDAGFGDSNREAMIAFQRAHAAGTLPVRTYLMMLINDSLDELIEIGMSTGFGDAWLRIGNAKLYTDGSIGGRTARMLNPYVDQPDNVGLWMEDPEEMKAKIIKAHKAGFQQGQKIIALEADRIRTTGRPLRRASSGVRRPSRERMSRGSSRPPGLRPKSVTWRRGSPRASRPATKRMTSAWREVSR